MHGRCAHWAELACPIPSPDSLGLNKYALQFTQGDKRQSESYALKYQVIACLVFMNGCGEDGGSTYVKNAPRARMLVPKI